MTTTKNRPCITLSFVASLDGKITMGNNPDVTTWASKEDQKYFKKLIKDNQVIITGSKTYGIIKKNLKHSQKKYRIIMTRTPEKYKKNTIPHKLEFTSETPKQIINKLAKQGIKKVLLAGGGIITSLFLKEKLIDRFILTLEPKIFLKGTPMFTNAPPNTLLKLKTIQPLNKQGTVLLIYDR